jgi:hypothetical protein
LISIKWWDNTLNELSSVVEVENTGRFRATLPANGLFLFESASSRFSTLVHQSSEHLFKNRDSPVILDQHKHSLIGDWWGRFVESTSDGTFRIFVPTQQA